jgi:hypothetical protein
MPDVKLPDLDLRDRLPDVDLSKLSMPSALRDLSLPDVHVPDVRLPKMDMPSPAMPEVDLHALDPRRLDLSGLDPKRLRALTPFAKPARKPASPLPWIVVAGVAGMFAGWFLATSPMAHTMVGRIRARLQAWRSGRSEWDDAEERTEGFWANEQGWRQEGASRGGEGTWDSAAVVGGGGDDVGVGGTGSEPPTGDAGHGGDPGAGSDHGG